MNSVHIYIDRLVLNGIDRIDVETITHAFESELQRLLSDPHARAAAITGQPRVDAGSVRVGAPGGAGLGTAVAANIARSLLP